jgi:peptide/nickel transport system permease protein
VVALAFRRLLSAIPALLLLTVGLFVVVSAAPAPPGLSEEEAARRFLDLPVLFNVDPLDRPRIVEAAVARFAKEPREAREDEIDLLLRIGAAGLADLVTAMERLSDGDRAELSRDLAPLAFRMGLEDASDLDVPAKAERFWRRVLDDRGPDLKATAIRRALTRHLGDRGQPLYTRQLGIADTAVIAPLLSALDEPMAREDHEEIEALAVAAAIKAGASDVNDATSLQQWWYVHRYEYVEFDPIEHVAAHVGETRFGRWVLTALTHQLGHSWRNDAPVVTDLAQRAPSTLLRALIALLLAHAVALPLAAIAASRRGSLPDRLASSASVVGFAVPAFVLALILRAAMGTSGAGGDVSIVVALAISSVAPISRQARAAFLEVLAQDFVRTARAKGLSVVAVWTRHVARSAVGGIVALASVQAPIVLAATLVVEEVLHVDGLGASTMEAIRAHDLPWLMGLSLTVATLTLVCLVVGDVVQASIDPRARASLMGRRADG